MRVFWIVIGIVALVWLGFLHFDRNEVRLDLDKTNHRIDGVEERFLNGENHQDLNVGEEMQDEAQDAQEEIQDGIPSKEEQAQDEMQDEAEELKEQQKEQGNVEEDVPAKDEKKNKDMKDHEKKANDATSYKEQNAVVAFDFEYTNTGSEATHAFKLFDDYAYQTIDVEASEAYLFVDPLLVNIK